MKKKKIFIIIFITIFLLLIFKAFYGKLSMFFVDTSREVYVPMAMNKGAILYRDIYNIYAPLGYQVNAFLTKIFGENLNVYYWIGFINSLIILAALYFIMSLFIKKREYIFSVLFLVLTSCIFTVSLNNYIFPYSYSMAFALNAFLWSLYCLLLYSKKDESKYLILTCFLMGLSLSFKYEFLMFIIIIIAEMIIKKCSFKNIIFSLSAFLTVPVISLTTLIIQGVTFDNFYQAFIYMIKLSKSPSVHYLYSYLGFIPNLSSLKILLKNLSYAALIILILFYSLKFFTKKLLIISQILLIIYAAIYIYPHMVESNAYVFNSIGILTVIILAAYIIFLIKKENILSKDKLMLILLISAVAASFKCIFSISFNSYGTYYFPILFSALFIFFINYFPRFIKHINKRELKYYRLLILFVITITAGVYCLSNLTRANIIRTGLIQTDKGIIYTEKEYESSINGVLKYIKENTNKYDSILVLPQGAMINFLTDRKSDNKYFYLIPPNIEVFKEENIVKDLKSNLPDYIMLQSSSYIDYNHTYFCESFGGKICPILGEYYKPPIVFGDSFWIAVYEKK